MMVVKRVSNHRVRVGGTQHSGWLPEGASEPLPTPVHDISLDITIEFDGSGYLLCYASDGGDLFGDFWYETLDGAEEAAHEMFGVSAEHWQNCS